MRFILSVMLIAIILTGETHGQEEGREVSLDEEISSEPARPLIRFMYPRDHVTLPRVVDDLTGIDRSTAAGSEFYRAFNSYRAYRERKARLRMDHEVLGEIWQRYYALESGGKGKVRNFAYLFADDPKSVKASLPDSLTLQALKAVIAYRMMLLPREQGNTKTPGEYLREARRQETSIYGGQRDIKNHWFVTEPQNKNLWKTYFDRRPPKEGGIALLDTIRALLSEEERENTPVRKGLIQELADAIGRYGGSPYAEPGLFSLADLFYDQAESDFLLALEAYGDKIDRGEDAGDGPLMDYNAAIRTYERFINQYPTSGLADQVYFQLGHLLSEQGDLERSNRMFETLVRKFPNSSLAEAAYLRTGDYYFDAPYLGLTDMSAHELYKRAIVAYEHALFYPTGRYYSLALYKLGWSYYMLGAPEIRMKEYEQSVAYFKALLEDDLRVEDYVKRSKSAGIAPAALDPGYDLRDEAIKYIAINFRDRVETGREEDGRNWAKYDVPGAMKRYVEKVGRDKPYAKRLMLALADVYREVGKKEAEAVTLDSLIALYPNDPATPRMLQRMIDAYEDLEQMALADPTVWKIEEHAGRSPEVLKNRTRGRLFRDYGRRWAESAADGAERAEVLARVEQEGWRLANWLATKAEESPGPQGLEEAALQFREFAEAFPDGPNAYTARWNYGQYMWRLERYAEAYMAFAEISRDNRFDKYREAAARNTIYAAEKLFEEEKDIGATALPRMTDNQDSVTVYVGKMGFRSSGLVIPIPYSSLSPVHGMMVVAYDNFAGLFPTHDGIPEMMLLAARRYFEFEQYESAREIYKVMTEYRRA